MKYNEICEKINGSKEIRIEKESNIQYGKKLELSNGSIINCYDTGKHVVQGKNKDIMEKFLQNTDNKNFKKVFVVYGHNEYAKIELEALLRRWDLEPIILDQKASSGKTIIEKLERIF